jgi:hypothetical protein
LKNEILKNEILKEEENRILLCESRFCLFLHAKFFREINIERIYKKIHIEKIERIENLVVVY